VKIDFATSIKSEDEPQMGLILTFDTPLKKGIPKEELYRV